VFSTVPHRGQDLHLILLVLAAEPLLLHRQGEDSEPVRSGGDREDLVAALTTAIELNQ
jgi:hypothetical protein